MDDFNILVSGGWTEIFRNLTGMLPPAGCEEIAREKLGLATELADFQKAERAGPAHRLRHSAGCDWWRTDG